MISATVIAHSKSVATGCEVATLELTFPRYLLPEFNTHRDLSRNSGSSRAIPFKTMLQRVKSNMFAPDYWPVEKPGMVGGDSIDRYGDASVAWIRAGAFAIERAEELAALGVHKSLCNRLLEPFAFVTVVATATSWANLLVQREHPSAEPNFQILAHKIHQALKASFPAPLKPYQWHLPYVDSGYDWAEISAYALANNLNINLVAAKASAARCARVSRYHHGGSQADIARDIEQTFKRLVVRLPGETEPGHWSPLEHPCKALPTRKRSGNFVGFEQLRKGYTREFVPGFLPGEESQ